MKDKIYSLEEVKALAERLGYRFTADDNGIGVEKIGDRSQFFFESLDHGLDTALGATAEYLENQE